MRLTSVALPSHPLRFLSSPSSSCHISPPPLPPASSQVRPLVEAMLEVAAYPDFSIASMSFNFWAKLARQLRPPRGRDAVGSTRFSAPLAGGRRGGEVVDRGSRQVVRWPKSSLQHARPSACPLSPSPFLLPPPLASAPPGPPDTVEFERQRRVEFFKPAFEKLVAQIRGRLRYPSEWSSWSKEEHMDFKRQR
jgi:hypothetical protein